jgi:3-hydroxyisobutyrate dehydrogenase
MSETSIPVPFVAKRIGWLGHGALGRELVRNLVSAGHELAVYDTDPRRLSDLPAGNVRAGNGVHDVVCDADLVFSAAWNDASLLGIVRELCEATTHVLRKPRFIDMTTVSAGASAIASQKLEVAGISYLRAPVSGSIAVARRAELSVYASGPRDLFDDCLPVLRHFSRSQLWLGPNEESRSMKLVINLLLHASSALLGEAIQFGVRAGLDRVSVVDAINASVVASPHYLGKAEAIKRGDYTAIAPLNIAVKDVDLALEAARDQATPLPMMAQARQYLAMLVAHGRQDEDIASLADAPAMLTRQ